MKRPAICLFITVAIVGWAAIGHAKKGGGGKAADAGEAKPADDGAADTKASEPKADAAGSETSGEAVEPEPGKVEEEIGAEPKAQKATTTLTWKDIVVLPRKAFLKGNRLELAPFSGVTVNDNLIRHYVFGVDLNYFLTDALWVGVQGQYYVKQTLPEYQLLGLQYNRLSSANKYLYGGSLNFGYVPVYGKFAWINRRIVQWEIWASAGFGVTMTEVMARDPANDSKAFKNTALTPNVGIGSRFFLADWLTVNFALRDYIIPDKYEPNPNTYANADQAKANADSKLVNNLIFYVGVGIYFPMKFTYKTPG
jgi:outer membrane beta-barrel protein